MPRFALLLALLAWMPPAQVPLPGVAPRLPFGPAGAPEDPARSAPPARVPSRSADVLQKERALAALVDEQRAAARVRLLVGLGARMGGTASGTAANRQRQAAFAALGLRHWVEQDGPTWNYQERSWRLVAHLEAGPLELERTWPYGFSPPIRGRFPLALSPARSGALLQSAAPRPSARGALETKVILVDGRNSEEGDWPKIASLPPGPDNPYAVFGIPTQVGAVLRAELAAGRAVELEVELETHIQESEVQTVFASIPAAEGAPPGYLLFCAHGDGDAGGPGANDNGSGEAIVMEIAAAFARARATGLWEAPPRELRFALWGKEIHSSAAHLQRALAPGAEPLLGVINFDQSGFGALGDRLYLEPDDEPHHRELLAALVSVLEDHREAPQFPRRYATVKSLGGTDSYVFSRSAPMRERGAPALTLYASAWDRRATHARTEGAPGDSETQGDEVVVDHDPFYHSAGDTPENTTDKQPYFLGWNARVGLLGGLRWLDGLGR